MNEKENKHKERKQFQLAWIEMNSEQLEAFLPKRKRGALLVLVNPTLDEVKKMEQQGMDFFNIYKPLKNSAIITFTELESIKEIFDEYNVKLIKKYIFVIKQIEEYDLENEFVILFQTNNIADIYKLKLKKSRKK